MRKILNQPIRAAWRWMRCLVILLLILIATLAGLYLPNLIYYFVGGRDGELVGICFLAGVPFAVMAFNLALKIIPDNAQILAQPGETSPNTTNE